MLRDSAIVAMPSTESSLLSRRPASPSPRVATSKANESPAARTSEALEVLSFETVVVEPHPIVSLGVSKCITVQEVAHVD